MAKRLAEKQNGGNQALESFERKENIGTPDGVQIEVWRCSVRFATVDLMVA
jgi:hypothetical protein